VRLYIFRLVRFGLYMKVIRSKPRSQASNIYTFIHQVMVASKKKYIHTKIYNKQIRKQK